MLIGGTYQPISSNEQGHCWSEQLQLFLGVYEEQLRFFATDGQLVPTPQEATTASSQQAEAEQRRNSKLAAKLRELGIAPAGITDE